MCREVSVSVRSRLTERRIRGNGMCGSAFRSVTGLSAPRARGPAAGGRPRLAARLKLNRNLGRPGHSRDFSLARAIRTPAPTRPTSVAVAAVDARAQKTHLTDTHTVPPCSVSPLHRSISPARWSLPQVSERSPRSPDHAARWRHTQQAPGPGQQSSFVVRLNRATCGSWARRSGTRACGRPPRLSHRDPTTGSLD